MVVSVKPYVPDPKEPPTVPNVDSEKSPTANKQKTNAKMQPSPKLAASDPERVASETPPEANLEGKEIDYLCLRQFVRNGIIHVLRGVIAKTRRNRCSDASCLRHMCTFK